MSPRSSIVIPGCRAGVAFLAAMVLLFSAPPTGAQVQPFFAATGPVSVSVDAAGSVAGAHTIDVEKPSDSAVVLVAFLAAASSGGGQIADGDVLLNDVPVDWTGAFSDAGPDRLSVFNVIADVTGIVAPVVDEAAAGRLTLDLEELAVDTPIDGEILAVVFEDPEQTEERTISLAFGGPGGTDTFTLSLLDPLDPPAPAAVADFGLGIAASPQGNPQFNPANRGVEVGADRLSTAAGGEDDGEPEIGALITAGGVGDANANPADPNAASGGDPRADDELYSLLPFFSPDATRYQVVTFNESSLDNFFFAYFVLSEFGVVNDGILLRPESAVNEVGTDHTVFATVVDADGLPVPGVAVTFEVEAGPNAGEAGEAATDSDGVAGFTYTGDGGPGTDRIVASFVDSGENQIFSNIVTKDWVLRLEITLTPDAAVNGVGEDHTVTAAVSDLDGVPQEGVEVSFEVLSGPNAGTTGSVTTDAEGLAAFTYTGAGGAGVDEIVASFVDPQGSTVESDAVTKLWVAPTEIALAPEVASALVGARHTVTATVTDLDGVPQADVELTFDVIAGPNAGRQGSAVTDEDGMASFTYAGLGGEGLDAIQASFVDALDVTRTSDLASVEWLAPPLEDPRPDLASSRTGEILVIRELGAGLTGILAERLDDQGGVLGEELLTDGDAVYSSPSAARLTNGLWVAVFLRGRPLANAVVGRFVGDDGLPAGDPLVIDDTGEVCDLDPAFACPLAQPDVAALPGGGFVVVWRREGKVRGRIFDGNGDAVGSELTVGGTGDAAAPVVAGRDNGSFVVAYEALGEDPGEVRLARYSVGGILLADVAANLFSGGLQSRPAIAAAPPDGRPVVLWESFSETTGAGIFGRVDPEDDRRPEFQANSSIDGDQLGPALAVEPSGLLAAAWLDAERGVLAAQRFSRGLIFVGRQLDLAPSVLLGSAAADPVLGRPRAVSLADGTLAVVAGIAGDEADPDGGAAVAFTGPTPLAVCFEDGRLVRRTDRVECAKLRFRTKERPVPARVGPREKPR